MVAGDILHSNINNKEFKSRKAERSDICTDACFNRDVEFDWAGMKND